MCKKTAGFHKIERQKKKTKNTDPPRMLVEITFLDV